MVRVKTNGPGDTLYSHIVSYPSSVGLTYSWSLGSLAGLFLSLQITTGVFLAMYYIADVSQAFLSVERIMRDVHGGWLIRYMHSNGASFFFILLYLHMFRGIMYKSYAESVSKLLVWYSGILIYVLVMAIAFMGYVLPWGQMSFWAATVITNLITVLPTIGYDVATWIWGGYTVSGNTLNRFYALHTFLPFIVSEIVILHMALAHSEPGGTSLGNDYGGFDLSWFHPYFYTKDMACTFFTLFFFSVVVFFYPNYLSHPDNYNMANPMITPSHIVPEWYFLFYYSILRTISSKFIGVVCVSVVFVIMIILPFLDFGSVQGLMFRPLFLVWFWGVIGNLVLISWLGAQHLVHPYLFWSQFSIISFFIDMCILLPLIGMVEEKSIILSHYYTWDSFTWISYWFFKNRVLTNLDGDEIRTLKDIVKLFKSVPFRYVHQKKLIRSKSASGWVVVYEEEEREVSLVTTLREEYQPIWTKHKLYLGNQWKKFVNEGKRV